MARSNSSSHSVIRLLVFYLVPVAWVVLEAPSSHAAWLESGVPVCSARGYQEYPQIVTDGAGGAIIIWPDDRNGSSSDIYAQRVDRHGNLMWTATGVAVCTENGTQRDVKAVADGSGGAIITWNDDRNATYDVFAQRVSASGVVQWTPSGVPVCSESETQMHSVIASDGAGGAIIVWEDYRSAYGRTYAQRVGASGSVAWTPGGVLICNLAVAQYYPRVIPDGAGGAIVTWDDDRNGSGADIFAQRIDAGGNALWTPNGIAVCSENGVQYAAEPAFDGEGGAFVTWIDGRPITQGDIYVQRVDAGGNALWTSNGVPVCTSTEDERWPRVIGDGDGGAIVAWQDERFLEFTFIYARRVNEYGEVLWAENGVGISDAPGDQFSPQTVSDGEGGAIITWTNWLATTRVYAQRIDTLGNRLWGATGVSLSPGTPGAQFSPTLVRDDWGGVVVAWSDSRTGGYDIYAQEVDGRGYWGHPVPTVLAVRDVPNDQGGFLTLAWERSSRDRWPSRTVTHYSVWRSLSAGGAALAPAPDDVVRDPSDIGRNFRGSAWRSASLNGTTYWWEWIANADAHHLENYSMTVATVCDSVGSDLCLHHFFVAAHTESSFVFWDSEPDSGYSVDNLAPEQPGALAGTGSGNPAGLRLVWRPNVEPDLSNYAVYRGLVEDFVPDPENLMASPVDTTWFDSEWRWDSGYFYKLSAVDIHRNESGYALLRPEDVTGQHGTDAPAITYLSQNAPNPFAPSTRIAFGLAARAEVRLEIYDVSGRIVRTLVDERRLAGRYVEIWDGRDGEGRALPNGVYSYRLRAGPVTRTMKTVLVR